MKIINSTPKFFCNDSRQKKTPNLNFRGKELYTLEQVVNESCLSVREVVDYISVLTNKVKFINKILGKDSKTQSPFKVKLGEAVVFVNMDKTEKGKTRVNIFADNGYPMYKYNTQKEGYQKTEPKETFRQSLDVVISDKDGRMIQGSLVTKASSSNFDRNTKSGKRELIANNIRFVPNLYECHNCEIPTQFVEGGKAFNTVGTVLFNLFSKLSLVKPDISLIK